MTDHRPGRHHRRQAAGGSSRRRASGCRSTCRSPDRATLGGAVAANASGPRRLGYGTLRDYVIGISFVNDEGQEVKAGGRVVKNVAGYDLMKLHIGALGTLGVITQVTLKVRPRPEDAGAGRVRLRTRRPSARRSTGCTPRRAGRSRSELLNAAAARAAGVSLPESDPWVIVVGFEEKAATVAWQVATLKDELKAAPVRDVTEFRGAACEPAVGGADRVAAPAGVAVELQGERAAEPAWRRSSREAAAAHPDADLTPTPATASSGGHVPATT